MAMISYSHINNSVEARLPTYSARTTNQIEQERLQGKKMTQALQTKTKKSVNKQIK